MESNLRSIDLIIPETNKYEPFPPIVPERFNSITKPLPYSLLPVYFAPTKVQDYSIKP